MIFTVENIAILIVIIGVASSMMCMILKHEWDIKASNSKYWIIRKSLECELRTGLYIMLLQSFVLMPFYGFDVLALPFAGAGIVNYLIR